MHIILTAICGLLNLYAKKFRCPDVLTAIVTMINLVPDFSPTQPDLLSMTRKQATIAVRSGLNDDEQYGCVVPPIHLSSTYNFTGFNEPRAHDYSRRGNPTRDVVQRALAELEGGAGAVLTNTGMSAIHLVTTVFLKPGDLLVAPHDCYGGSYRLFDSLAKRGCYRVLFVDQGDERALQAALAENRSWCW